MRQLNITHGQTITPALRKFALTLHFYSPSAYDYVRNIFSKSLPHVSTLRKWYSTVNGLPGFSSESFRAIAMKVEEMKKCGKQLFGCMIIDEMSVKQHVNWTGTRHQGYIDYGLGGTTRQTDNLPFAKDAFVIIVVGMNTYWKIPVAYYLIAGITAEEKANIILSCLEELCKIGIKIKTLTFDGAANNLAMSNVLGAKLQCPDLKPTFQLPSSKENIHIILDPCHMIKLLRNTLGDWGTLFDPNNQPIKWIYFKELVNLQNQSLLHAATKIRTRHIQYFKEKMKVKLAVQIFSNSVCDALIFCNEDLKLAQFQGCEATIEFSRRVNNIFDILNSRNLLSKSPYSKAIDSKTIAYIFSYISESIEYLKNIQYRNKNGVLQPIITSIRKTGFLGLITSLTSLRNLATEIIETKQLQFILSYKFSQDHIEMLFSAIRAKGGFNNNPTVAQFEAAYKSIIVHAEVKSPSSTNCMALDDTSILRVSSTQSKTENSQSELLDLLCSAGTDIEEDDEIITLYQHGEFIDDIVSYIAGFVVRKMNKVILCETCLNELKADKSASKLLDRKNRGGLIKPSNDVISLCKIAEKVIRSYQGICQNNVVNKMTLIAMTRISIERYFQNLSFHILDQESINNHLLQLIKLIFNFYITIRLHHINSSTNEIDVKIRSYYTKLILFKHQ